MTRDLSKRYSRETDEVIKATERHARLMSHSYCGSAHLLLGMLDNPTYEVATTLMLFDVTTVRVEQQIFETEGPRDRRAAHHVAFTPECSQIFEEALEEASRMRQELVRPEHLLIALINADGEGARVLEKLGVDLYLLRENVKATVGLKRLSAV